MNVTTRPSLGDSRLAERLKRDPWTETIRRRFNPEPLGNHLSQNGAVTLALRHRGDLDGDGAERIDGDRRDRLGAVLAQMHGESLADTCCRAGHDHGAIFKKL